MRSSSRHPPRRGRTSTSIEFYSIRLRTTLSPTSRSTPTRTWRTNAISSSQPSRRLAPGSIASSISPATSRLASRHRSGGVRIASHLPPRVSAARTAASRGAQPNVALCDRAPTVFYCTTKTGFGRHSTSNRLHAMAASYLDVLPLNHTLHFGILSCSTYDCSIIERAIQRTLRRAGKQCTGSRARIKNIRTGARPLSAS